MLNKPKPEYEYHLTNLGVSNSLNTRILINFLFLTSLFIKKTLIHKLGHK